MGERAASRSTPKPSQKQTIAGGVAGANNAQEAQKPIPGMPPGRRVPGFKPPTPKEGAKIFSMLET